MLPYTSGKSFLTGITVEDGMSTDIERDFTLHFIVQN